MKSLLYEIPEDLLLDFKYEHLEYFPLVNSRVFSISGKGTSDGYKKINNIQLRGTYQALINMTVHLSLNGSSLDLPQKVKL